ncbi:MAG: hypothetical protein IJ867_07130 [Clostridia bacterium]|nr:hypothetical protein [Clostridia bacterium]
MKKHLKALRGFPFGIMMLAISYALVYLIDGEATYIHELGYLTNVNFLIAQCVYSGIVYTILFEAVILFDGFQKRYSKNVTWGAMFKFIAGVFVICLLLPLVDLVLKVENTMSQEVGTVLVGLAIISMIVGAIGYIIYQTIEKNKINQALKEKNQKPED